MSGTAEEGKGEDWRGRHAPAVAEGEGVEDLRRWGRCGWDCSEVSEEGCRSCQICERVSEREKRSIILWSRT